MTTKKRTRLRPTDPVEGPSREGHLAKLTPLIYEKAVADLVAELRLGVDWTWILVGDGSGNRYGNAIGAACVGVRQGLPEPIVWTLSASDGTNNVAEALAYLLPLNRIVAECAEDPTRQIIHVVTDSEWAQQTGRQRERVGANAAIWAAVLATLPPWIEVKFHHKLRGHRLNAVADDLSRRARLHHYKH